LPCSGRTPGAGAPGVARIEALRAAFPPGIAAGLRYPEFQLRKLGI
jgi:hypothetical protein